MLSYQILSNVRTSVRSAIHSRNIGVLAPCLQKATDPIQQLFVDKIREYKQKSNEYANHSLIFFFAPTIVFGFLVVKTWLIPLRNSKKSLNKNWTRLQSSMEVRGQTWANSQN